MFRFNAFGGASTLVLCGALSAIPAITKAQTATANSSNVQTSPADGQPSLPAVIVNPPKPRRSARTVAPAPKPIRTATQAPRRDVARTEEPTADRVGSSQYGAGLGGRFTGYTVDFGAPASATKDNTPILQTPANVQVVTRQAMDDRQDISVRDAIVGYVSSVQPPSTTADSNNFYDGFNIRGFDNANIYRNDLRVWEITGIETSNLQSIEVLKGPAAMLYGRLEPGGIVNLVTKQPLDTPYSSIQEQFGSWGTTRTTLDTTGPLTADKEWLYRFNMDYDHAGSFTDYVTSQNVFINPSLTWRPTQDFHFNIDAEYQKSSFVDNANGFPAIGNGPAPIPVNRYIELPLVSVANPNQQERELIGFNWTYDFDKDWSVTNRFAFNNIKYRQFETLTSAFDPATDLASFNIWDANVAAKSVATNLDLKGKFDTGPFEHSVLLGADYWYLTKSIEAYFGPNPSVNPINIFSPAYTFSGYTPLPNNGFFPLQENWTGLYAQDMVSFLENKIHFLFGGRYDWAQYGTGFSSNSDAEASGSFNSVTGVGFQSSRDQAFSPRLGLIIQPVEQFSLYANYTKSFGVTNGIPVPGNPAFGPETAVQWEGGAKAELLDKHLTATLAYFDITKSNIVAPLAGTPFSIPVGLVNSHGVELDVAGRVDEHWSLTASYAYDDARIVNGEGPNNVTGVTMSENGNWLQDVPRNAGSLWLKYDATGQLRGLSVGGGIVAVGMRQGDNQNDFQLPGYTRFDAMLMYKFRPYFMPGVKNLTAQLNVRNLFNTVYYQSSSTNLNIFPGASRTILASLRAEW